MANLVARQCMQSPKLKPRFGPETVGLRAYDQSRRPRRRRLKRFQSAGEKKERRGYAMLPIAFSVVDSMALRVDWIVAAVTGVVALVGSAAPSAPMLE